RGNGQRGASAAGRRQALTSFGARPRNTPASERRCDRRSLPGGAQGWRVRSRVADGQDLPQVAVGILPVHVLPAEPTVDLHVVGPARRAPVRDARGPDAGEDRVELFVAHSEAHVLALHLLAIGEVEGEVRVDEDGAEVALRL